MTFGHDALSWTPITHLMAETRTFNAFTEVTSDYTGDYYLLKPVGNGTYLQVFDKTGTTQIVGGNAGSGSMTREEKIQSALNMVKSIIGEDANYVVGGRVSDYWSGHPDYKKDGLDPDTNGDSNGDTNGDANGDANGDTNGDLDPEPCDDANRETTADGSCASSCKTGYDFESSSADAKCVLVDIEKGTNWPLVIGGIAVLGIGYFVMNK